MRLVSQEDIDLVKSSGLFNAEWYKEQYQDVGILGMDPVEHYLWIGGILRRDPSPQFSARDYLETYSDVAAAKVNPLMHYLRFGQAECRHIFPSRAVAADRPKYIKQRADGAQKAIVIGRKCVAIFAAFDKQGNLPSYVEYYLRNLRNVCDKIVFVADNDLTETAKNKLENITSYVIDGAHGEYDFGSYKRGYVHAKNSGWLDGADEILLCNDSCVGPVFPIERVFRSMREGTYDFWGITDNDQIGYHLQSYFICLNRKVFESQVFIDLIMGVGKKDNVDQVVAEYEVGLTSKLTKAGFTVGVYAPFEPKVKGIAERAFRFKLNYPNQMIDAGNPFVKTKALRLSRYNLEGVNNTLSKIEHLNPVLHDHVVQTDEFARYQSASEVRFSIIMPMFNRAKTVERAIRSVQGQVHQNWELLMVDDGSTDGTEATVLPYLVDPRIKYLKMEKNGGVSAARNMGLSQATGEFISYLDSDNVLRENFLSVFANATIEFPTHKVFYSRFCRASDGMVIGQSFDLKTLMRSNFIDLGTFVHHRACYTERGGFDTSLKRLVDWDLILNYTRKYFPVYISGVLMDYTDDENDNGRISVREDLVKAYAAVRSKHTGRPIVTTAIVSYNQEKYIAKTIESAIKQVGNFIHEIIIADDGSTDATPEIAKKYATDHPRLIRIVGDSKNVGISENFKRCFREASGEYIAILEGDDLWNSEKNLDKKVAFFREHENTSMVFSKLGMMAESNGKTKPVTFLERQTKLKRKILSGQDFIDDPDMNLIVNFSSCLFRTKLMLDIPEHLYTYRLSEIGVAFYLDKFGGLGYINEHLTTYRVHDQGVWSGLSLADKLKSARKIREIVRDVANDQYKQKIDAVIEEKYNKRLRSLGEAV